MLARLAVECRPDITWNHGPAWCGICNPLTEREVEVLRRIAEGDRNRDIGEHLGIAEDTVKVHVKRIMDKLGAKDRTQAVAIGIRRGVISL